VHFCTALLLYAKELNFFIMPKNSNEAGLTGKVAKKAKIQADESKEGPFEEDTPKPGADPGVEQEQEQFPPYLRVIDRKGTRKCNIVREESSHPAACLLEDDEQWPGVIVRFPSENNLTELLRRKGCWESSLCLRHVYHCRLVFEPLFTNSISYKIH
jgi:hypothetical protein